MVVYDKSVETIITELKKKTFAFYNNIEGEETEEKEVNKDGDSLKDEDEESETEEENIYVGADLMYQTVEIDDFIMKEEFNYLKSLYW